MIKTINDVLTESRNGANEMFTHPLFRRFIYSDGVKELADAGGCWWLLDILATECGPKLLKDFEAGKTVQATIEVKALKSKATIAMRYADEGAPAWQRKVAHTDLPDGDFTLLLGVDQDDRGFLAALILLTEC